MILSSSAYSSEMLSTNYTYSYPPWYRPVRPTEIINAMMIIVKITPKVFIFMKIVRSRFKATMNRIAKIMKQVHVYENSAKFISEETLIGLSSFVNISITTRRTGYKN